MVVPAGGGGHLQLVVVVTGAELHAVQHDDQLAHARRSDEVAVVVHAGHSPLRVRGREVGLGAVHPYANLTDTGWQKDG